MIKKKMLLRVLAIAFLGTAVWIAWPIYGFVSNQFEVARSPLGWDDLPEEAPKHEVLGDPRFAQAGALAINLLEQRRKEINAPSLSAAIAIDGKIVWAGAVGWRDVKELHPITTQTSYRIGSTSKAVGITGLARLVDADIVNLNAPISTYSNDLPNEAWEKFTTLQLASHTAGLAAYEENNDWLGFYKSLALTTRFNSPRDALSVIDGADLLHEPASDFHYSGFDNVLLSAVMQDAAAMSFDELMSEYVFTPLQLKTVAPDHLRDKDLPFAISYQVKGKKVKPWRSVDLSHKLAAGGYVSTPSDLAMLGTAWLDDGFIQSETREVFWTPVRLSNGEINGQDYALGFRRKSWPIKGVGNVVHLNHGGVSKGAQCWFMIVPEHSLSLAISTNRRTDEFFDFADIYVDLLETFIPVATDTDKQP